MIASKLSIYHSILSKTVVKNVVSFADMYPKVHKSFNRKLVLTMMLGRMMKLNLLMRMLHGNGKNLLILYQNIPGTYNSTNVISKIEYILQKYKPHILGIAESES